MKNVEVKALVIDDEEDIRLLLSSYLRKKEVKTQIASNLTDGLSSMKYFQPDIVFLDNNLPDGSGIETIQQFRSLNPDSKIIIISALTILKDIAIANGADYFLGKPISFENIQFILDIPAQK